MTDKFLQKPDERLIKARNILIIGLEALEPNLEAVTVIGAQSVFEHTKELDGVPFTLTTDSDLSVIPWFVDPKQNIKQALLDAGFIQHRDRPGIWGFPNADEAPIGFDLLVPEAVAGPRRRGARVPNQDKSALGRAAGLELSLVDRNKRRLYALDGSNRSIEVYVAGPGAIMCAKAYKLTERLSEAARGGRNRVLAKDAGDIWRLMAVSNPVEVREIFNKASTDPTLDPAIALGRKYLKELFDPNRGQGLRLAIGDLGDEVGNDPVRILATEWIEMFE